VSVIKKIFWISLFVKLVLAALLPLTNDEAYYWVWSQYLQLSYYDHPPFVAWLFWLGDYTRWFPGSVRWPGVLFSHAGLAIWLMTLKPFLNEDQRRQWLWLVLLSPLLGGSAIVLTPDLPLMFFYALSAFLFFKWRANPNWKMSLLFGLSMGLGFSSKYMMVLFTLSLLPLLVFSREIRNSVSRTFLWLLLGAVVGACPVWIWNMMNDFASFKFQVAHGLGRRWKPSWTYEYIGAQIALVFPVVLYWALRARRSLPPVFHLWAWVPLLFFMFTTSRGYVEANWPIAAYPAVFALAASQYPLSGRGLSITCWIWGILLSALAVVIIVQPSWSKRLKFREFHQFDRVVEAGAPLQPLFARSYQMASKLHFELRRPVFKLKGMNRRDFFDYLEGSRPMSGIYYLAVEKTDSLPANYTSEGHKIIEKTTVDERYEIWKVESP
jgi:4-amino-4-deoxy-L-arabinose transferase-like glycosyltransferase